VGAAVVAVDGLDVDADAGKVRASCRTRTTRRSCQRIRVRRQLGASVDELRMQPAPLMADTALAVPDCR
jgi:hypothetical protein